MSQPSIPAARLRRLTGAQIGAAIASRRVLDDLTARIADNLGLDHDDDSVLQAVWNSCEGTPQQIADDLIRQSPRAHEVFADYDELAHRLRAMRR